MQVVRACLAEPSMSVKAVRAACPALDLCMDSGMLPAALSGTAVDVQAAALSIDAEPKFGMQPRAPCRPAANAWAVGPMPEQHLIPSKPLVLCGQAAYAREAGAIMNPNNSPGGQARAPCSLAGDVWAVGVLAYELLVGGPPFEADTKAATYQAILAVEPWVPAHLSPHVRDFLLQARLCV